MAGIFQQLPQETFNHKFSMLDDAVDCLLHSSLLKQRDTMTHLRHPQFGWVFCKQITQVALFLLLLCFYRVAAKDNLLSPNGLLSFQMERLDLYYYNALAVTTSNHTCRQINQD